MESWVVFPRQWTVVNTWPCRAQMQMQQRNFHRGVFRAVMRTNPHFKFATVAVASLRKRTFGISSDASPHFPVRMKRFEYISSARQYGDHAHRVPRLGPLFAPLFHGAYSSNIGDFPTSWCMNKRERFYPPIFSVFLFVLFSIHRIS